MRVHRFVVVAAVFQGIAFLPALAQGNPTGWKHQAAIYLWGAGMDGTAGARGLEADVNVSFSDLLENLEIGGMAAYRGESGRWAVMADLEFVGLGATKDAQGGIRADVDADQWLVEVDGAYRFTDRVEGIFGARLTSLDTDVVVTTPTPLTISGSDSRSWIDPVVGARLTVPMGEKWSFVGRGDVGGFGIGSDFTWQALLRFGWQVSDLVALDFGYRVLDVDYDDGTGTNRFVWDVQTSGPVAAVSFTF